MEMHRVKPDGRWYHNEVGVIIARQNGKSTENWKWTAVKAVEILEEEKSKFPEGNTHKMDMSNAKEFEEKDFMEALSYIGLLP